MAAPVKNIFVLHVSGKELRIENMTEAELDRKIKSGDYNQGFELPPNFSEMPVPERLKDGNIMNFRGTVVIKGKIVKPKL